MKTELIDEVLENGTGNFLTSQNGRRQLYSVFKSDKTGWSVVGVSDVSEFMKNRSEIQFFYLLIALCLGVLSLLLALWLSGEITKPVKELEQSMKNVQKGEFDKALISPEGCNEITSLTHSFNIMTENRREKVSFRRFRHRSIRISFIIRWIPSSGWQRVEKMKKWCR